jgi:hypothetical protein
LNHLIFLFLYFIIPNYIIFSLVFVLCNKRLVPNVFILLYWSLFRANHRVVCFWWVYIYIITSYYIWKQWSSWGEFGSALSTPSTFLSQQVCFKEAACSGMPSITHSWPFGKYAPLRGWGTQHDDSLIFSPPIEFPDFFCASADPACLLNPRSSRRASLHACHMHFPSINIHIYIYIYINNWNEVFLIFIFLQALVDQNADFH